MHQVYDDEMTFKLVAAASNVSGLPVEVCLEEFGKHFLVYCQKNGYDQILRVLGSNLYDFLTNLDNLHDHLASIYPGMRAPSFRVTRHLNTNQPHRNSGDSSSSTESRQQQLQQASLPTNDELHRENATCSLADGNSMYLHYYSERAGLSPIVKGLVMAVAKEFFQTDILVAECQLLKPTSVDDHVVLKIDRRQIEPTAAEPKEPQRQRTSTIDLEEPLKRAEEAANKFTCDNTGNDKPRLNSNLFDSLSTSAKDSMVSSEMMMQTFPFHVIFDRRFRLVQVGKSLLRATSRHWQRHQQSAVRFNDLFSIIRPKIEFTFDAIADHTNQVFVVRTRPQVLNADALRCQSEPMTRVAVAHATIPPTGCPMDRLALAARKRRSELAPPEEQEPPPPPGEQQLVESSNDEPAAGEYLSLRLKGQMIILLGGELCLFLCSPRVDHLDQLMECGIRMSDFALHDRARELMLMSHTHKEDRETVKKLDQATNDLKKMDAKLRMENERTNEVLHNIFPAKIAALLSHGHKVESESFDSVTCLYSDIIGFTKMCGSENVRPIDIVRLLNTLYLQFDNLTNIHQVFKVETIGDAYVVVGGLPEPAQDHADRCVKMGLDMVKVIATVRSPADKEPIQMRIGIHSGPVMAGIVGIRVPRYSLFGNTTTLANQLETNGVGGKIHISDFTLKSLIKRDKFVVEDNPNELAGFPFSPTYFVTNYISDQQETRDHEKILEEQLIKDLQLMGNEVELVDDLQMDQLASIANQQAVASTSLEALAASAPILAAPTWRGAAEEPDAAAREATSIPKSPGPGRRTLSESLAAAADNFDGSQQQLQQFDRLILMDIEERKNGHKQVQQMSARLSAQIMGEALEQATARMKVADRKPSAVELLLGEQADLELVLRATSRRQRAAACTLCGQVAPSGAAQGDVIRVRVDSGLLPPSSSSDCASCSAKDSKLDLQLTRPRLGQLLEWLAGGCAQPPDCTATDKGVQQSGGSTLSTSSSSKLTSQPVKSATPINGAADRLGLERLLEELRLERRKLEAQVERLSQQLTSAPSPIHLTAIGPAPPANCLNNRPPSQVASSGDDQPACQLRSSGRSQVPAQPRSLLSSNIQRMKRMDTLKLRKLKKQQQQQAESGSPLEPNGNSSADSSSSRPRDSRSGCSPVLLEEEPEQEEQRPAEAHAGERVAPSLVVGEQHPPSLRSPDTPTQADPPPTPKTYKIGNYNYQALRHSLAGLLGEHSGGGLPMTNNSREGTTVSSAAQQSAQKPPQAQPPTGKRRFNLNPFAGMSSPFGSSAKDHPAQGAPPKRGGSCSCLRTSASNQSVQSHESP